MNDVPTKARSAPHTPPAAPQPGDRRATDAPPAAREPLWTLFRVVLVLSALSWGGLALMAQLELYYVERERRFTRLAFSDLIALSWMVPGAVGCNVAVQVGHALRGAAGAWVAGIAAVLPFFCTMTAFAIFYDSPFIRSMASPELIDHFAVVLGSLIAITWYRQLRAVVHTRLQWLAAAGACAILLLTQRASAFVLLLAIAFMAGWIQSPTRGERLAIAFDRSDKILVPILVSLVVLFALPLPLSPQYQLALLWPRLAGAAMTLFGGGFSALPVLKTLFVAAPLGVTMRDFTLAFALSPVSPGPLLNVIPFLGYLTYGSIGAVAGTVAFFVPSGLLIIFARRHLQRLEMHARFEHGMRVLRAAATSFLIVAVVHVAEHVPLRFSYVGTAVFAFVCLGRLKLPVYAVYAMVALTYAIAMFVAHR
ncbi:MAG TPA: chromate transporter [Trinickia sp.]|jgi:chromate transporter|uniref:chromate transporter n=1 Tax=Trinickia sp. TaxID=2571163 RepID=UPI002F3E53CD